MKLNNILLASCALLGTLTFTGCVKYDGLFDAEYHRVLNIKDAGVRSVELYTTNPEGNIPISIMKTGSEKNITANGLLSSMSEETFANYCKQNDLSYSLIPSEYYTLNNNEMQFGADERYKFVNAVIKTRELKSLIDNNPENQYVLPLLLSSTDASVNDSLLIVLPDVKAPTLGFTTPGFVSAANFTPSGPSSASTTLQLEIPVKDEWGVKCTLASNDEAKAAFDAYNKQNESRYVILPSGSYNIPDNGVISFEDGATTASVDITFDRSQIGAGEYILPLAITDVTVDGFVVDESKKVVLLGVISNPDKINIKVEQLSANSIHKGDGTGLQGLIDGIGGGKHFHSIFKTDNTTPVVDPTYGNYIQVKLNSPIKGVKFDYWTRFENGDGAPKHIKIFVSSNGNDWTELGEIKSGLPMGGNQQYSSRLWTSEKEFNYFRLAVLQSAAGSMTAGSGSYFNLGELVLYGN